MIRGKHTYVPHIHGHPPFPPPLLIASHKSGIHDTQDRFRLTRSHNACACRCSLAKISFVFGGSSPCARTTGTQAHTPERNDREYDRHISRACRAYICSYPWFLVLGAKQSHRITHQINTDSKMSIEFRALPLSLSAPLLSMSAPKISKHEQDSLGHCQVLAKLEDLFP